jgi:hypothetical protein
MPQHKIDTAIVFPTCAPRCAGVLGAHAARNVLIHLMRDTGIYVARQVLVRRFRWMNRRKPVPSPYS